MHILYSMLFCLPGFSCVIIVLFDMQYIIIFSYFFLGINSNFRYPHTSHLSSEGSALHRKIKFKSSYNPKQNLLSLALLCWKELQSALTRSTKYWVVLTLGLLEKCLLTAPLSLDLHWRIFFMR